MLLSRGLPGIAGVKTIARQNRPPDLTRLHSACQEDMNDGLMWISRPPPSTY
ncbi:MAG: hypothetical protein WC371_05985 [Parachlamydiales bacterium]